MASFLHDTAQVRSRTPAAQQEAAAPRPAAAAARSPVSLNPREAAQRQRIDAAFGSPLSPVQGYFSTPEVPGARMSDGDKFISVGKQALFAKSDVISSANSALHDAGAIVSLQGGDSIEAAQGTFLRVQLVPDKPNLAGSVWSRMKVVASEDQWRTFADCYRNSATVSGMGRGTDQGGLLRLRSGDVPLMLEKELAATGAPANVAAQARMTLFKNAYEPFKKQLAQADAITHSALITKLDSYLSGKPDYGLANSVYLAITKSPIAFALFNETYGVNSEVVPQVGTALTQVNDEKLTKYLNDKDQDKWNFHWAGIVLVDGSDYVTLENCAVEMSEVTMEEYLAEKEWFDDNSMYALTSDKKMDIVNERWYFTLHGKKEQSFHAENLKDSHSTDSALTLGLTHG